MSYTVTCGSHTEEFSLDCTLADVQAYFNVLGGGLLLNGTGPVVRRVYDGCAYELKGATVAPPKVLQHVGKVQAAGGRSLVAQVEWTTGSSAESSRPEEELEERALVEKVERLYQKEAASLLAIERQIASKPVEWAVVGSSTLCSLMFIATLLWYLTNYDPTKELALREEGDKLTVESLTALAVTFSFGCLAFFSS